MQLLYGYACVQDDAASLTLRTWLHVSMFLTYYLCVIDDTVKLQVKWERTVAVVGRYHSGMSIHVQVCLRVGGSYQCTSFATTDFRKTLSWATGQRGDYSDSHSTLDRKVPHSFSPWHIDRERKSIFPCLTTINQFLMEEHKMSACSCACTAHTVYFLVRLHKSSNWSVHHCMFEWIRRQHARMPWTCHLKCVEEPRHKPRQSLYKRSIPYLMRR